jgi:RHS repeat-associated protein
MYRYAFQGQELDKETGMEAFQLRLWDGRIGRWLSPDPYGQHFSLYLGMGNSPVNTIDPDGGWETKFGAWWHGLWDGKDGTVFQIEKNGDWGIRYATPNGSNLSDGVSISATFGGQRYNNSGYTSIPSKSLVAPNIGNTLPCVQCHNVFPSYAGSPFDAFQAETQLGQGLQTTAFGVVGIIGSGYAIIQSGGTLAAVGGAAAFTMSIGEIGIGLNQIAKWQSTGDDIYKTNTVLGRAAFLNGSSNYEYWDAVGGFLPGMVSGGNIKGVFEIRQLHKIDNRTELIRKSLESYDAYLDTKGLWDAANRK